MPNFGKWPERENRKNRRVPLRVPIECHLQSEVAAGQAENISVSGLLVRCSRTFDQDTDILAVFTLPGAARPLHCNARVAHVVPAVFMGLEFTEISASNRDEIEHYIATTPALPSPAPLPSRP